LLWRLRRIISIETDLLRIQSEIVRERRAALADPTVDAEFDLNSSPRHLILEPNWPSQPEI
jgi:hypothetical protein